MSDGEPKFGVRGLSTALANQKVVANLPDPVGEFDGTVEELLIRLAPATREERRRVVTDLCMLKDVCSGSNTLRSDLRTLLQAYEGIGPSVFLPKELEGSFGWEAVVPLPSVRETEIWNDYQTVLQSIGGFLQGDAPYVDAKTLGSRWLDYVSFESATSSYVHVDKGGFERLLTLVRILARHGRYQAARHILLLLSPDCVDVVIDILNEYPRLCGSSEDSHPVLACGVQFVCERAREDMGAFLSLGLLHWMGARNVQVALVEGLRVCLRRYRFETSAEPWGPITTLCSEFRRELEAEPDIDWGDIQVRRFLINRGIIGYRLKEPAYVPLELRSTTARQTLPPAWNIMAAAYCGAWVDALELLREHGLSGLPPEDPVVEWLHCTDRRLNDLAASLISDELPIDDLRDRLRISPPASCPSYLRPNWISLLEVVLRRTGFAGSKGGDRRSRQQREGLLRAICSQLAERSHHSDRLSLIAAWDRVVDFVIGNWLESIAGRRERVMSRPGFLARARKWWVLWRTKRTLHRVAGWIETLKAIPFRSGELEDLPFKISVPAQVRSVCYLVPASPEPDERCIFLLAMDSSGRRQRVSLSLQRVTIDQEALRTYGRLLAREGVEPQSISRFGEIFRDLESRYFRDVLCPLARALRILGFNGRIAQVPMVSLFLEMAKPGGAGADASSDTEPEECSSASIRVVIPTPPEHRIEGATRQRARALVTYVHIEEDEFGRPKPRYVDRPLYDRGTGDDETFIKWLSRKHAPNSQHLVVIGCQALRLIPSGIASRSIVVEAAQAGFKTIAGTMHSFLGNATKRNLPLELQHLTTAVLDGTYWSEGRRLLDAAPIGERGCGDVHVWELVNIIGLSPGGGPDLLAATGELANIPPLHLAHAIERLDSGKE